MATRNAWSLFVAGCLLAAAAAGAEKKVGSTANGTGIWLYTPQLDISIVNMTEYTLDWSGGRTVSCVSACLDPWTDSSNRYIHGAAPYRTLVWHFESPYFWQVEAWDGATTFWLEGQDTKYNFKMVFLSQNDDQGYAGKGTWVSLQPVTWGAWKGYNGDSAAPDFRPGYQNGRYVTRMNDKQMHNIMTMVSDHFVVSLYSPNNNDIVVVVQQNYSPTWGSDSNSYKGFPLNWADNAELSCPGPQVYPSP
jgi:hypothetical protein